MPRSVIPMAEEATFTRKMAEVKTRSAFWAASAPLGRPRSGSKQVRDQFGGGALPEFALACSRPEGKKSEDPFAVDASSTIDPGQRLSGFVVH
ncbi:hypothetical protein BC374_25010 [Ensifer sp. LC13]|nr:hypothetical protein BBX50_10120 [Ensifer sp. LC11]OCP05613.1 hypothetical protein BC374_25010 [Ensifer sp. LC13]OCP13514.1 hypothetical protein BC362_04990 [Ensifer sp. LC14]OCP30783.1 hypothetical protein BC364_24635 [Ensifer sp. LC499]